MADLLIDSIESFMLTLEKERNFSLHTIKAYKNDLNRFNYFLNNTLSRKKLAKINRNDIRKFLAEEYDNGYSSKTVARRLATIKSYFKYLVKKVIEEINEFYQTPTSEEMADVVEVLLTIGQLKKLDYRKIEKTRLKKLIEKGGFKKKYILKRVLNK